MLNNRNIFIASVIVGFGFFPVLPMVNIDPWAPYAWIILLLLGLSFGFLAGRRLWLWPLGIFLGQTVFGVGNFLKDMFFYSGGGANMFIPIGIIYLIPLTLFSFIGSFSGFGIKKVINHLARAKSGNKENRT